MTMRKVCAYRPSEVAPYINWLYFFHAWAMNGKPQEAREAGPGMHRAIFLNKSAGVK